MVIRPPIVGFTNVWSQTSSSPYFNYILLNKAQRQFYLYNCEWLFVILFNRAVVIVIRKTKEDWAVLKRSATHQFLVSAEVR